MTFTDVLCRLCLNPSLSQSELINVGKSPHLDSPTYEL